MTHLDTPGEDGLTPVARTVARDEIGQLVYRYAAAVDRRDIPALAALFAPEADFAAAGTGPEGAAAFFNDSLGAVGVAVLVVGNHLIDFDGPDTARGEVWCRGYIDDHDAGFIEQMIRYHDRYRRIDGHWRFVGRSHRLWYGVATAESPLDQPDADWPARPVGRGSLPYSYDTWQSFWSDTSGDG